MRILTGCTPAKPDLNVGLGSGHANFKTYNLYGLERQDHDLRPVYEFVAVPARLKTFWGLAGFRVDGVQEFWLKDIDLRDQGLVIP